MNPEGGAELFNYTIPLGGGEQQQLTIRRRSRAVKADPGSDSSLTVGLNAVQYIYSDQNESNISGTGGQPFNNNDVFIIGNQIPVTWKVNKALTVKAAPGFTFYTGGGNVNYGGGVPTNYCVSGIAATYSRRHGQQRNRSGLLQRARSRRSGRAVPARANSTSTWAAFRSVPTGTFEWNTQAHQRVQSVYLQNGTIDGFNTGVSAAAASQNTGLSDGIAWAAGLQIGANKKKGDWSVLGEFRQIGLGAVDQNINGTDYADSYRQSGGRQVVRHL